MFVLVQQQARLAANDMPQLLANQAAKQLDAGYGLQLSLIHISEPTRPY